MTAAQAIKDIEAAAAHTQFTFRQYRRT